MSAPERSVERATRHGGRPVFVVAFAATIVLSLVVLFSPGSTVPGGLGLNDKVVHFLLFAALACTGRLAGIPTVPLGLALVAYAGVSEVLQGTLPLSRDGDWRDALSDSGGVCAGLATAWLIDGRARRRREE